MPEQPFENDNTGEVDENAPANNNEHEQSDGEEDDDENQSQGEEEEDEPTPDFTDDDYGADFPDDVLCPEIAAERPQEYESLNNIIVIDNLPKVDQERLKKLKGALAKVYNKYGEYRKEYYPVDEEGNTKGYGFFEFENEQKALDAVKETDGYRLDRNHTFSVTLMSDFERLIQIPPEPTDSSNLLSWLTEPDAVDQFAIQSDDLRKTTTIYANTLSGPVVIEDRSVKYFLFLIVYQTVFST
jgi:translation initiation factor 3 subunit B